MSKNNSFNPLDWANNSSSCAPFQGGDNANNSVPAPGLASPSIATNATNATMATVATAPDDTFPQLLAAIEASGIDITSDYTDWFRIGTAIASTYGEQGREYFHIISKFHNSYTIMECDKKYDQCLRDANPSITIGTIFHLAKQHGITLPRNERGVSEPGLASTANATNATMATVATVATEAMDGLSPFLQSIMAADNEPTIQHLLLFGSLISLSAVMPHVSGVYGGKRVYANLYGFVVAPPASSKGRLADVIQLIKPIDDEIRLIGQQEQEQYQLELAKYKAEKNPDAIAPKQPPMRRLLLPANASSTAMYQALNDNHGSGITFETEGDTASQTLKSDYGNYSDGLRKAFHHEPISYMRRKDAEDAYIQHPRWSVLLSGTPAQVTSFIPNSENGLFSRFLFYCLPRTYEWRNVFENDTPMDDYFKELGDRYLPLYHALKQRHEPLLFRLSKDQQDRFNDHFSTVQQEYASLYGDDLIASIRRLGLICFRVAMVMSITRFVDCPERLNSPMVNGQIVNSLTCLDEDFDAAISLVESLMQHTAHVYSNLLTPIDSAVTVTSITDQQQRFLAALPDEFTYDAVAPVASSLRITKRTADRWLGQLVSKHHLLTRLKPGHYQKVKQEE